MIKTAIFDLDGVIVDTSKYHYMAWRSLAQELGFEFSESDSDLLKGVDRMRSLDILLSLGGVESTFSNEEKVLLAAKKSRMYVDLIEAMSRDDLLYEVDRFIEELRYADIKTTLISMSKNTGHILKRLEITDLFDVVVDGNMVNNLRSYSQLFSIASVLTSSDAKSCVAFENVLQGIEAAHKAGMRCVGVGDAPLFSVADMRLRSFEDFRLKDLKFYK